MPKTFTTLRLSQQLKHYNNLNKGSQYDRFVLAVFLMTNVYNIGGKEKILIVDKADRIGRCYNGRFHT